MISRKIILAALAGGPLAGAMLGLAIDPTMKPGPEPIWERIDPDPIVAEPQRIVDAGPQDLSPTWYMDRMPTWKRRAAMREAAMYEQAMSGDPYYDEAYYSAADADYREPEPEPVNRRPEVTVVRGSTVFEVRQGQGMVPVDGGADEAQAAARQANAAVADAHPAAVAVYRDEAGEDGAMDSADAAVAIDLPRYSGT